MCGMDKLKLTDEMLRVLRIAGRDGAVVAGKGAHAGHVERVHAPTIQALIHRGLLFHSYGPDGGLGGKLTAAGRAALSNHTTQHATRKTVRAAQS